LKLRRSTIRPGQGIRVPALIALATAALACGSAREAGSHGAGGATLVVARPMVLGGFSLATLTVSPGSAPGQPSFAPFSVELSDPSAWSVDLTGIPAGQGRVLAIDAVDGGIPPGRYTGSVVVDVPAGGHIQVAIPLQPVAPPGLTSNSAPVVDTLTIDALTVPAGAVVALGATAHDPDAGDAISYAWSTSALCGIFSDTGRPSTNRPASFWEAPATPGTCRLTLAVRDGRGAEVSVYADVTVTP
jgi:hypothetical protein